jgi:hypothetical protein
MLSGKRLRSSLNICGLTGSPYWGGTDPVMEVNRSITQHLTPVASRTALRPRARATQWLLGYTLAAESNLNFLGLHAGMNQSLKRLKFSLLYKKRVAGLAPKTFRV